jgi:hypothetical protein
MNWEKLMTGTNIIKYVKAQRIKWWRALNRVGKTKTVRKITEWNHIGTRIKGRRQNKWGDKVLNDLKRLKVDDWTI